jgi:LEM3-like protein/NUMOD3 motif-containing protein
MVGLMMADGRTKIFYVYELRDERATPFYVGKGSGRRIHEHAYRARSGERSKKAAKIRSILSRGGMVLAVIILETRDEAFAYSEERRLIAVHGRDRLANLTDGGEGVINLSTESRAKIAAARLGRTASPETREKQRQAKLGKPRSVETRKKISAFQKGSSHPWARLPRTAEHRRKLATFTGKKHTPETLSKMRRSKIGHVVSVETRAKISKTKRAKSADR